ncbi:inhibitor of nuclear factor kappa-B kinase-interacting protein isoform X2 [Pseudophryne corroboree]|uniref:inhibitor of nuclear factor kappa-B kinase-interacting protein isoform X2 n=1 Tax=Pseudophryne corroboree TaxID=495146 RepID=UPI003081ED20
MSNEVKQRKKGGASTTAKEVKDTQRSGTAIGQRNGQRAGTTPGQQEGQRSGTPSGQQEGQRSGTAPVRRAQGEQPGKVVVDSSAHGSRSQCSDIRTVLCSLCLAICVALIWTVFQHSQNFAVLEQKYQALQSRSSALEELESKVGHIIGKLEKTTQTAAQLKDTQHLEQLQKDINSIEQWMMDLSAKRRQLEASLTTVEKDISHMEQSTTTTTKDISTKIATVKTDVRRISGMESDIVSLINNINELEKKLEKVEKNIAQSIGDALVGSIDRITALKSSVSRNSDRIDLLKKRLTELRGNFSDNFDQLSQLESDRLKVMQAVHFANELKPKVFTLRKDFANLESLINDLSLRIGRLASDILSREKEISLLSDKMYNLTVIKSEIVDLNNKIGDV